MNRSLSFTMPVCSLGSNGSGQLGLGHQDDTAVPALVHLPSESNQASVVSIRAGGNHTLLLTSTSEVYSTGNNTDGRCATPLSQTDTFFKSALPPMAHCAATWDASVFVSKEDGSVRVCGTGLKGELGLGSAVTNAIMPTLIPIFPPSETQIVDLAACMGHVVAVLSNGEVWGWGNGQQGQLGEPAQVVWEPRRIDVVPFHAVRAVCGKDFTAVFSSPDQGEVTIVGLKKRDRFNVKSNTPDNLRDWKDVQATWGSIYVLKSDGSLIAWGRDDHGQLPPQGLPQIDAIAAGSEHVLALTANKTVLTWGWGEHGNCGEPVDERKDVKRRWNELRSDHTATAIGGGCATSWIVTSDKQDA